MSSNKQTKTLCDLLLRFLTILLLLSSQLSAQTFSTHVYAEDVTNIANPERGFYKHTETSTGTYSYLNEATLRSYRSQGITLALRLFYLNDFASKPISEEYLAAMRQDFNTARAAGVKLIIRFAYTKKSTSPYGDATPAWALQHVEQLAPVLRQNGDVIAVVQAGFIGAWGEWYYTDHFSATLGNPNATDWQNRRDLVNALLAATPATRSVQIRTPGYKFTLMQSTDPVDESEAFNGTAKSRLGHHNDCFLASSNDFGTYTGNIEVEKAYLEEETKFLPMGGETCNESVPLSECPNALAQMERFHWSYLNRDYHSGVLGSWQDGACMPEVFQRLGYRFYLTKSVMQNTSKPGGVVELTVKLRNNGWATPYNPRKVEIVLKHTVSGKTFILPIDEDPRRWSLTDTTTIEVNAGLPQHIAPGSYKVYLHLPDPEKTLYGNPDYSIRMANTETWDAATGYNDLHHTLVVSTSASVPPYIGGDYFTALPAVELHTTIAVDGESSDWQNVPVLTNGTSVLQILKVFNTSDKVYFLVEGISDIQSFEIKIDADYTAASGELSSPWNTNYADYRITSTGISHYQSGSWSAPQPVMFNVQNDLLEIEVAKSLFASKALTNQIEVACKVVTSTQTLYLPLADGAFASYRLLISDQYALHSTSSGSKVILYWANESNDYYRTIERSIENDVYEKIAVIPGSSFTYIDQVSVDATVQYRTYLSSADGFNVSNYAEPLSESTSARPLYYQFASDGEVHEWEDVVPLTTTPYEGSTMAYRIFFSAEKLNVFFEGGLPEAYTLYFNTDNSIATGTGGNAWNYTGFDFMLRNDSLYDIRGDGKVLVVKGERGSSANVLEVEVPVSELDNLGTNTIILTAGSMVVGEDVLYFPATTESPAKFLRTFPAATPSSVTVSNSENFPASQLIVQWQSCSGCKGYVVERSENSSGDFTSIAVKNHTTFAHYDSELSEGTTYYYRVFSYNDAGLSVPSPVVSGKPASVTTVEDELYESIEVYPNPAQSHLFIEVKSPGAKQVVVIDAMGQSAITRSLSSTELKQSIDVTHLKPGLYFVKVSGRSSAVFKIAKK